MLFERFLTVFGRRFGFKILSNALLNRFWMDFGRLSGLFWKPKCVQKSIENLVGFGSVSGGFLMDCGGVVGTLDLQK